MSDNEVMGQLRNRAEPRPYTHLACATFRLMNSISVTLAADLKRVRICLFHCFKVALSELLSIFSSNSDEVIC